MEKHSRSSRPPLQPPTCEYVVGCQRRGHAGVRLCDGEQVEARGPPHPCHLPSRHATLLQRQQLALHQALHVLRGLTCMHTRAYEQHGLHAYEGMRGMACTHTRARACAVWPACIQGHARYGLWPACTQGQGHARYGLHAYKGMRGMAYGLHAHKGMRGMACMHLCSADSPACIQGHAQKQLLAYIFF